MGKTLIALPAGRRLPLVGVSGLGKTKLVETPEIVFGLGETRVRFTPGPITADIPGFEVPEESENGCRSFRFNSRSDFLPTVDGRRDQSGESRNPARALRAMRERRVSVVGHLRELPGPVHVLATHNPLEKEPATENSELAGFQYSRFGQRFIYNRRNGVSNRVPLIWRFVGYRDATSSPP